MKKILTILLLLPFLSIGQVGVNTTTPGAALDVESSNNGVLIPRVQLTSTLDVSTVVNPQGGALQTSTLVYNIAPAGVVPNNVVAGFYYWNGSLWTAIAGNAPSDHDWYEVGTTTAPNAITDDIFHTGNVAIGKNTADYPLEVNTTNFQFGFNNIFNNPTATNVQKATINNTITDNTNDSKYGVINNVTNNSTTSGAVGVRNNINGDGNVFYGNSNYLSIGTNSNGADIIGVRNNIDHNSNNSNVKGMYNIFNGTYGNLNLFNGLENDFRVSALRKTGVNNIFNANTDGFNVGMYNSLSCNLPLNDQYGVWNNVVTGAATNGDNYGLYNYFSGSGNSRKFGIYTRIDSNGDGQHIGSLQFINGSATGLGTKYGTLTTINSNAGGVHYGIHSTVLKPGATNFAGYFLGNVGIGTTASNTYTFPPSRGTNGQIMQTDGAGNLSWTNPLSLGTGWSLFGNSAIITPANPAIYGTSPIGGTENYIGTTNAQAFVVGTNNIERMRVLSSGNVGIGLATAPAKLSVFGSFLSPTIPNATTNAMLRIGNNIEGLDIGKAGVAGNYSAWLQSGFNGFSDPLSLQPLGGNVGIATTNPTHLLHVNSPSPGAVRIVDGTQAEGRVLTSDATGVATWRIPGINAVLGNISPTGVSIAYNEGNYLQTGTTITLPPGTYAVQVTMLLARNSLLPSPNDSSFWVRSTFSDLTITNPPISPDIVGSNLISGNFPGTNLYAMLAGTVIINNSSGENKTYYYVAGRCVSFNTTETLTGFASTAWLENTIFAIRLN